MPDLNKMLSEVQKKSSNLKDQVKDLLGSYESLLREGNKILIEERMASNDTADLNDFLRLMLILKRNRDVVGSLLRGISNVRPVNAFKFIEEDVKEPIKKQVKKHKAPVIQPEEPINPELIAEEVNTNG